MSDKLQFVVAFGSGRVAETSDKLKFVGHFHRHFALLPNSPTVSRRFDILLGVKPSHRILIEDYTPAVEKAVMFVNRLKSSLLSVRRWVMPWMFIAAT